MDVWPNTALDPTPVAPVSFRFGFLVCGSHRRRGSHLRSGRATTGQAAFGR
jgi:hypothetical protein